MERSGDIIIEKINSFNKVLVATCICCKDIIKKLFDNQYVFEEIKTYLIDRFVEYLVNRWSTDNLYQAYINLGLNLVFLNSRCLSF